MRRLFGFLAALAATVVARTRMILEQRAAARFERKFIEEWGDVRDDEPPQPNEEPMTTTRRLTVTDVNGEWIAALNGHTHIESANVTLRGRAHQVQFDRWPGDEIPAIGDVYNVTVERNDPDDEFAIGAVEWLILDVLALHHRLGEGGGSTFNGDLSVPLGALLHSGYIEARDPAPLETGPRLFTLTGKGRNFLGLLGDLGARP